MLYQKILSESHPYTLFAGSNNPFMEHRHADIEFFYCAKGDFEVLINRKRYLVREGELALVGPMVSHEIPDRPQPERMVLTVTVGVSFLKKFFDVFSSLKSPSPVCQLMPDNDTHQRLRELLEESVSLYLNPTPNGELLQTGNLYKICWYLLNEFLIPQGASMQKDLQQIANVESALNLIYYQYRQPLTIEDAAQITGYGKTNFCKIFKQTTGESFHNLLNQRRIQKACELLGETSLSVSEIAHEVGFADTKTLCRVFKTLTGMTPGTYRTSRNNGIIDPSPL